MFSTHLYEGGGEIILDPSREGPTFFTRIPGVLDSSPFHNFSVVLYAVVINVFCKLVGEIFVPYFIISILIF